jgi:hypothetical protein
MPRTKTILTTLATLAALTPGHAALAAGPQPPHCPLFTTRPAIDHALQVIPSVHVVVRDPYGGLLPRNRLEFDFSVRSPSGGSPSGIASVSWAVDGVVKRTDSTAPYDWRGVSGSDRRIAAGDHEIAVTVTPTDGQPKRLTFPLTATNCQPASTFAEIGYFSGGTHPNIGSSITATSSLESGSGPTMRSVAFEGTGINTAVPSAARGRVAGKLVLSPGGPRGDRSYILRVPRSGSTLLQRGALRVSLHPGATRVLTLQGLPAGIRSAAVTLTGRGGAHLLSAQHVSAKLCRYSLQTVISGPAGRVRVDGGRTSGLCAVPGR